MKFNKNWKIKISENNNLTLEEIGEKNKWAKKILIYFYPKDNTPGCTGEALDFSNLKEDFKKKGVLILGISPDSLDSHKKFIKKHKLKIILASDEDKKLSEKLGVWGEKKNYGKTYMSIIRSTFLIDLKNREIEKEWRNVRAKGHAERILRELDQMDN